MTPDPWTHSTLKPCELFGVRALSVFFSVSGRGGCGVSCLSACPGRCFEPMRAREDLQRPRNAHGDAELGGAQRAWSG